MSINPDNVNRSIRRTRRTAWLQRNSFSLFWGVVATAAALGLVLLMVTPR